MAEGLLEARDRSHTRRCWSPYRLLGQLYASHRKLDAARETFEEVLEREPDSVSAHTVGGMCFTRCRATALRRASGTSGAEDQMVRRWLPTIWRTSTRRKAAISMSPCNSRRRPSRSCRRAGGRRHGGWVYTRRNCLSMAIPLFEQAVAKDPGNRSIGFTSVWRYSRTASGKRPVPPSSGSSRTARNAPEAEDARKALAACSRRQHGDF